MQQDLAMPEMLVPVYLQLTMNNNTIEKQTNRETDGTHPGNSIKVALLQHPVCVKYCVNIIMKFKCTAVFIYCQWIYLS